MAITGSTHVTPTAAESCRSQSLVRPTAPAITVFTGGGSDYSYTLGDNDFCGAALCEFDVGRLRSASGSGFARHQRRTKSFLILCHDKDGAHGQPRRGGTWVPIDMGLRHRAIFELWPTFPETWFAAVWLLPHNWQQSDTIGCPVRTKTTRMNSKHGQQNTECN